MTTDPVITVIMYRFQLPARLIPDLVTTVKHVKVIQVTCEVVIHSSNSVFTNWSNIVYTCVLLSLNSMCMKIPCCVCSD